MCVNCKALPADNIYTIIHFYSLIKPKKFNLNLQTINTTFTFQEYPGGRGKKNTKEEKW
jgi:hypothetical protein